MARVSRVPPLGSSSANPYPVGKVARGRRETDRARRQPGRNNPQSVAGCTALPCSPLRLGAARQSTSPNG